jgi:predicted transcriptional regulator
MSTSCYTDTLATSESATQPQLVIWGTNINIHKLKTKFQEFLKVYTIHEEEEQKELTDAGIDVTEPYYVQKLEEVFSLAVLY